MDENNKIIECYKKGTFIMLPFKVGDTVYIVDANSNKIRKNMVDSINYWESSSKSSCDWYFQTKYLSNGGEITIKKRRFSQIGKTIFLNKKDAEENVLKKMKINNKKDAHIIYKGNAILTKEQKNAVNGRILEGTPWAARSDNNEKVIFFVNKPFYDKDYKIWADSKIEDDAYFSASGDKNNIYDFVKFEDSPVYLPNLLRGE